MDNKDLAKKNNEGSKVPEPDNEIKGTLTFDDKVIQKIVGIALEEIDGLLTVDGGFFSNLAGKIVNTDDVTSGVDVEVGKQQVAVDLDIVAEYGRDITNIYDRIKKVVSREVKQMTGLDLIEVNVNVVDVKSEEQYEKDATTVQDKLSDAAETTGEFVSKQTENAKEAVSKTGDKLNNQASKAKKTVDNATESRVK
ncbi:Asp23/Gls24 family envelope stress response protein [Enterococcus sp. ALS3]|uniref:Stress response regulator gls24 homolog n=1 Tax=Enterococcus alishanensis TaxID=1303817 RepID=A0ABS6THU8_9ENTE|nr:Asp23/Gls24 family envelope stress response protein [Enterococcus alishanensis]MBV7392407.1 Asp23/Gls24 family envelope stress response protein [Enterococcus alishanensis]